MKTCKECGIEKESEEFYSHSSTTDGRTTKCKDCCRTLDKSRHKRRMQDAEYRDMKRKNAKKNYRNNSPQKERLLPSFISLEGEVWADCKGYAGHYKVSNLGRVYSLIKGYPFLLKQGKDKDGYSRVGLVLIGEKQFQKRVHRLVAEAFIPNPENMPMVNHINAIKSDNRLVNLEWVNQESNMAHAKSLGLFRYKPRPKLPNHYQTV